MEPSVMNIYEKNNILYFTLSNTNVSYANALRRTILSNIPTVVIRTFPYEKNDANFSTNTIDNKATAIQKAKIQGYEGEACGECGNFTLVRNGTCMKCNTCGSTSGCS